MQHTHAQYAVRKLQRQPVVQQPLAARAAAADSMAGETELMQSECARNSSAWGAEAKQHVQGRSLGQGREPTMPLRFWKRASMREVPTRPWRRSTSWA